MRLAPTESSSLLSKTKSIDYLKYYTATLFNTLKLLKALQNGVRITLVIQLVHKE